jgi:hypothetical protein
VRFVKLSRILCKILSFEFIISLDYNFNFFLLTTMGNNFHIQRCYKCFLSFFQYFKNLRGGLWNPLAVFLSVCLYICIPPPQFWGLWYQLAVCLSVCLCIPFMFFFLFYMLKCHNKEKLEIILIQNFLFFRFSRWNSRRQTYIRGSLLLCLIY